jgi:predicted transglutaminase-like cysteine proteinase
MGYLARSFAGGFLLVALVALYPAQGSAKPVAQTILTPERMSELQQINNHVNNTIVEVSDIEQYGKDDVWTLPTSGKGDCEDFALLKRKLLIQRGWSASALSLAVGITSWGEAHAVLLVATASGDYVLDNLTDNILTPQQAGHVFLSRQSGRGWVSASGESTSSPVVDLPVAGSVPVAQVAPRRRRG